jgi:ornithine cyclodeaminase
MTIRILSAADVRAAIDPLGAIDAMRSAFGQLSSGEASVPLRGQLVSAAGATLTMPAYLDQTCELGVKIVSVFPDNAGLGLAIVQGAVLLLDAVTGAPRALLDGSELTARRTAAGSALATDLLATPDASVLALFGAGVQARAHVWALAAVRALREIRIVSRSGTTAEHLAAELDSQMSGSGPGAPVFRAVRDPRDALRGADLIVTATTSEKPVFDARHVEQGAHINAVGSFRPDMQEVDPATVANARVIVDSREAAWEEAGDLIVPLRAGTIDESHIAAELGQIVNGTSPRGRAGWDITLFKSVGNAAQDIAMASAVVAAAEELGLGLTVPL